MQLKILPQKNLPIAKEWPLCTYRTPVANPIGIDLITLLLGVGGNLDLEKFVKSHQPTPLHKLAVTTLDHCKTIIL